ncbi:MAG: hypothetical protein J2P23_00935 [Microlunatus sp.]|nr:hypothetical protein [Microlunatus sp.]
MDTTDPNHLHELELAVRAELTVSEANEPDIDAGLVADEPDLEGFEETRYEETERFRAELRTMIGAIEVLEIDGDAPVADRN